MRLSSKSRYGARAMIELAGNYGKKVLPVNVIAKNQNISERYLQNILLILVDAGLVNSVRGKNGGFTLSKEPSRINLADIVYALEEDKYIIECIEDEKYCPKNSSCIIRGVWEKASEVLFNFLKGITLEQLLRMNGGKEKVLDFNI
ncbi:MAG: Rrf2 family transcriptional regulator [Endomicrobia bacterium]|nr:Rrf2 family transcriptional regulator [Endomicrobiia bacterium]